LDNKGGACLGYPENLKIGKFAHAVITLSWDGNTHSWEKQVGVNLGSIFFILVERIEGISINEDLNKFT